MKKFDNFYNAFSNLKDIYSYEEPYSNVVLTGLVGLYGICFEQSWKAMKEILEDNGFAEAQTGSPRQILKTAYQAGLIKDEKLWLLALAARNNIAHAYNKEVAQHIINETKDKYYAMFEAFIKNTKEYWINN